MPTPSEAPRAAVAPSAWNIANGLTTLRLGLVPVFAWLALVEGGGSRGHRLGAFGVFVLAVATDRIDGDLARRRGLVTDFGKVVDPIADKALIGTGFVVLSMLGELAWWVTLLVLARELGVTALRFWVIRHGVIPASRGGKVKTTLQAVAVGGYLLPLDGFWHLAAVICMVAAVAVTVVTGANYVMRALAVRRKGRAATELKA